MYNIIVKMLRNAFLDPYQLGSTYWGKYVNGRAHITCDVTVHDTEDTVTWCRKHNSVERATDARRSKALNHWYKIWST